MADINRDGVPEFFVGADRANSSTGYVRVFSGATGLVLATISGLAAGDQFGHAVSSAGDVNKDSFPDLIIGAPGPSTAAGYAHVISGLWILTNAGTKVLHTFSGKSAGDRYGFSVSDAGDVDKDGNMDVLVGARSATGSGYAEFRSGKTGSALRTFTGGTGIRFFGQSVSNAGDVNNDTFPDAIIGAGFLFRVLSGKDGTQLTQVKNMGGKSVSGAGDVNHDNYDDVMVFDGATGTRKTVRVFSGKDWKVLHTFRTGSVSPHTTFQSAVGDVNGDGYADVIVQNGGSTTYAVILHSGKDGSTLLSLKGPATFGHSVRGISDVDGDNIPDVIVGARGSTTTAGSAHVYSSRKLAIATDVHRIDIAKGGTQAMSLDAGAAHANRSYWIFGSITGSTPGINLGGFHIPLNPDPYTDLALSLVSQAPFLEFRGTLDASGKATTSFVVPAALPLPPLTLHHAYVVFGAGGVLFMSSNAVPLNMVK
jgi:FG-GAP repeat